MQVLVWVAAGTWPAVIAAAKARPVDDQLILIAVDDPSEALASGAVLGLLGRAQAPDDHLQLATAEARALLQQAADVLGRACEQRVVHGVAERVIATAAGAVDLLILARDGDQSRLGPRSLGKQTRFIIDHAPCTVELLWPDSIPSLDTIPPAPPLR